MSTMRTLALLAAASGIAQASPTIPARNIEAGGLVARGESPLYGQCGGKNWSGTTNCVAGAVCFAKEEYYHQCVPATSSAAAPAVTSAATSASAAAPAAGGGGGSVALYGQCGAGKGAWTGPTTCSEGTCQAIQDYYSCLPGGSGASSGSGGSSGVAASDANATQKPTVSAGGGGGSVALYGQCGAGKGDWTGPTTCAEGTCRAIQEYYSQCLPGSIGTDAAAALPGAPPATSSAAPSGGGSVPLYGQCGAGKGDWTGPTSCASGTCQAIQDYYSQCLPGTASSSGSGSGTAPAGPAQSLYGQCGGKDYNGPTTCGAGAGCDMKDDGYSQCLPAGPKAQLYQQCGGDNFNGPKNCVVGATCKQLNQWYWQCFPGSGMKRDVSKRDVHSKRDIIQEIAKAFGFGANATSANGTLANATGGVAPVAPAAAAVPHAAMESPAVVASPKVVTSAGTVPTAVLLPLASTPVAAPVAKKTAARMYGQCGGIGFTGPTKCPDGFACVAQSSNAYYSQCLPGTLPANDGRAVANVPVEQAAYAQCGGLGYKGSTVCTAGTACTAQAGNIYFSQCIPFAQAAAVPQQGAAPAQAPVSSPSVAASSTSVPIVAGAPSVAPAPAPAPIAMKRDDATPPAAVYSQCGGIGWGGSTTCETGSTCIAQPNNAFYSQCMPTLMETTKVNGVESKIAVVPHWGQCGGQGWQGPTTCAKDSSCIAQLNNAFYFQCIPTFAANGRRDLINAKTALVLNPPNEAKNTPAAPAPAPKEVVDAPTPAPKEVVDAPPPAPEEVVDAPTPAPKEVVDTPEETPSLEPAKLDNTVQVVPRPSISASPSPTSEFEPVQTLFGQCGGEGYEGSTNCGDNAKCYQQDDFYFQCLPLTQQNYAQCGGDNYNGPTSCTSGACVEIRPGYKQCQPTPQRRGIIDADTSLLVNPAPAPMVASAPSPISPETKPMSDTPETSQPEDSPPAPQSTPEDKPPAQSKSTTQQVYGQCGGSGYSGPTQCEDGSKCYQQRNGNNYAQCLPTTQQVYGQCGGRNYTGPTACEEGSRCRAIRRGYSQCIPTNTRRDDSIYEAGASAPSGGQSDSIDMSPAAPSSNVTQESAPVAEPQSVQAAPEPVPAPQPGSQVVQPAPELAPVSAPAPDVAQAAPQSAPAIPQPQAAQPAPQPQVAQAVPQSQPAPASRPAYEVEDTKIPYNPTMDSLVKAPLSLLGQTSKVYAACGGIGFQGNTVCEAGSKCYTQNAYYSQCLPLVIATYQQCGGGSYFGSHECTAPAECMKIRPDYFQCLPPSAKIRRAMEDPLKMLGSSLVKTQGMFGQCGGTGWGGPKLCQPGAKCVASGSFYSQCLPDDSPVGKIAGKLNGGIKPPKLALPDLAALMPPAPAAAAAAPAGGPAPAAAATKPAR